MEKMGKLFLIVLLALGLALAPTGSRADVPGFMKARMGTVKGTLYVKGKKMPNAIVSFFDKNGGPPPIIGSARRVPDMVNRTNDKGEFSVQLLPGSYYMGAMPRPVSKGPGPPRPGEKYYFMRDEKKELRVLTVETRQEVLVGRVDGMPPDAFKELKDFVTMKGKITGEDNKPLAGIMVTLKDNMEAQRPKYISDPTKADGLWQMKVPPGKYYVIGRESSLGSKPGVGSYIGSYGKASSPLDAAANSGKTAQPPAGGGGSPGAGTAGAIAVEGSSGAVLKDLDLVMFKMPDPGETRKKFETQAGVPEGGGMEGGPPPQ